LPVGLQKLLKGVHIDIKELHSANPTKPTFQESSKVLNLLAKVFDRFPSSRTYVMFNEFSSLPSNKALVHLLEWVLDHADTVNLLKAQATRTDLIAKFSAAETLYNQVP
jgi:hypothetical protein